MNVKSSINKKLSCCCNSQSYRVGHMYSYRPLSGIAVVSISSTHNLLTVTACFRCLSAFSWTPFCGKTIHPTAKLSEKVTKKCCLQTLTMSATMQSITDKRTAVLCHQPISANKTKTSMHILYHAVDDQKMCPRSYNMWPEVHNHNETLYISKKYF